MKARFVAQAVADARLTPEALRVVLHVATLGAGEHAVKGDELEMLLHGGEKPIRKAITRAVNCGYLSYRFGGRAGHYLTLQENPAAGGVIPENGAPTGEEFPRNDAAGGVIPAPVVVGEEGGVVNPPLVPPVGAEAESAITSNEILAGCRGALRDYLRQRVPHDRQSAFVWSAVGWLNLQGFAWQNDEGAVAPPGARPGLLANALNQLLASDEKGYKAPVGDPRNLLQKLRAICGQHGIERKNGQRDASGNGAAGGSGGAPAAGSQGKGGRVFTPYIPAASDGDAGHRA